MKIRKLSLLLLSIFPFAFQVSGAAAAAGAGGASSDTSETLKLASYPRGRAEIFADLAKIKSDAEALRSIVLVGEKLKREAALEATARRIIKNDLDHLGIFDRNLSVGITLLSGTIQDLKAADYDARAEAGGAVPADKIARRIAFASQVAELFQHKLGQNEFVQGILDGLLTEPSGAAAAAASANLVARITSVVASQASMPAAAAAASEHKHTYAKGIAVASLTESDVNALIAHVKEKIDRYQPMMGKVQAVGVSDLPVDSVPHAMRSRACQTELRAACAAKSEEFKSKVAADITKIFQREATLAAERLAMVLKMGGPSDNPLRQLGTFDIVQRPDGSASLDRTHACMKLVDFQALATATFLRVDKGVAGEPDAGVMLKNIATSVAPMVDALLENLLTAIQKASEVPTMLAAASTEYRDAPKMALASIVQKWQERLTDLQARKAAFDF